MVLTFLIRTVVVYTIVMLVVQEWFYLPSRVTTGYLARGIRLPSSLSRYSVVTPIPMELGKAEETIASAPPFPSAIIGVHSLRYYARQRQTTTAFSSDDTNGRRQQFRRYYDGISLHHGFGASSLTWLPLLPSLVEQLGGNRDGVGDGVGGVGVARDATGFGFTDCPSDDGEGGGLKQYGSENSAGIGLALLMESMSNQLNSNAMKTTKKKDDDFDDSVDVGEKATTRSVAIFGHSMGARAALLTVLRCARDPTLRLRPDLVVLVAPALEGVTLPAVKRVGYDVKLSRMNSPMWSMVGRVWVTWQKIFVDPALRYGLRRLVCGTADFWRNGLVLAWGDPRRLTDRDVLRFQWPTVGRGWEDGIINFARSRILSARLPGALDDARLLREVMSLADTRVIMCTDQETESFGSMEPWPINSRGTIPMSI